jgi:hypothetical protein
MGKGALEMNRSQSLLQRLVAIKEKWGVKSTVNPAEKGKYKGWSQAKLKSVLNTLKKSGPHKKGSAEFGRTRELQFALRSKHDWGKVPD